MSILYATCFAAKAPEAYPLHNLKEASHFVTRSGFDGKAISFTGSSSERISDYIKADRSSLTELYMAFQYENKADSSYNRTLAGLVLNALPIFGIYRAGQSPRNLTVCRVDGGGSSYVTLGSGTAAINNSTVYNIEFRWKLGDADGIVQVWVNGVLDIDLSGVDTNPGVAGANMWEIGAISNSTYAVPNSYVGEVIVADARIHNPFTQRKRFAVLRPSGAGSNSQWNGAYSDVDEETPDDADGIDVNTVDQVSTFALDNLPSGVESIDAVTVWNRIVGQGGPTPRNVQPAVRTNSNNYFGDSKPVPALRPWYGRKLWALNPNTSSAWSKSEVNALEAGAKSVT